MPKYAKATKDDEPEPRDEKKEEGAEEVDLDDEDKLDEKMPEYDPDEEENLAEVFGKSKEGLEALRDLSEQIRDDVKQAQEDGAEEQTRLEKDVSILIGELPQKQPGFEKTANLHVPIMLKGVTRLVARLAGELFQDWKNFVSVLPVSDGPEEMKEVDVLSKHTNWQLVNAIPDFPEQAELGVTYGVIYSDVVCHSSYDPVRQCNRHEMLTPEEFVIPAVRTQTMTDLSDVPWRARILHYYRHTLESMRDVWFDVDKVLDGLPPSWETSEVEEGLSREAMRASGKEPTDNESSAPYRVVWYEGWLRLPKSGDSEEEDDSPKDDLRFCKAIVELETGHFFHLCVHEQDNWKDKLRHDRQLRELQAYRVAVDNFSVQRDMMQEQMNQLDQQMAMPVATPESIVQRTQLATQRGMMEDQVRAMVPPPSPPWAEGKADDPEFEPEPIRREPINLFARMRSIDPPSGPRGIPFGRMLADYNRGADMALSQFIDQATLNNCKSFAGRDDVAFKENAAMAPGEIKHLTGLEPGEDIRTALMALDIGAGNPQLIEIVRMCMEFADDAIQAPGVLVGDPGKSGETARGYSMRIEQAVKQLTTLARRFARFYVQIIKNNAALNAKCLPDEELFMVQDPDTKRWQGLSAGKKLYERDYAVEFRADMEFSSKAQKIQNAQAALQMVASVPNAQIDAPLVQYCLRKVFEAMGLRDYLPYMGPQAPPPPTPMGMPQQGMPGQAPPGAPQGGGGVPPGTSPPPAPKGQPSPPKPQQQPVPPGPA